jgi:alpha-beta hydrolase superfamily lysophospholipase
MPRNFIVGVLAALVLLAFSSMGATSCSSGRSNKKPWYELGMTSDAVLDQVLLFYMGEAWTGMTDVGEVLETAGRVNAKDPRSWSREWRKTAERLGTAAEEAEAAGHRLSAGELSLRAASYYRAALHRHMDPASPEVPELARREVAAFTRAMKLLGLRVERVAIPYEGTTIAAYWCRAAGEGRKPVIIAHQGRDAWAEDDLFIGREAARRGYDCLLVDGPGQGSTLRLQGLAFRPDWEKVIAPVVDWLVARPDVDAKVIGLMGMSMGGALAPRAAAYEPRISFLVANPGVTNWSATFFRTLDGISPMFARLSRTNPKALDALMDAAGKLSPFLRWGLVDSMWKHGVSSPSALLDEMRRYDASADIGRITCPTLVVDAEAEEYGDAKVFYDALACKKTYLLFTKAEAAPLHVQTASIALGSQRIFDWIDDTIATARAK